MPPNGVWGGQNCENQVRKNLKMARYNLCVDSTSCNIVETQSSKAQVEKTDPRGELLYN